MNKSRWTERDRELLKAHYPGIGNKRLSELFEGRTDASIRMAASRMDLKKCPDRLREMGRENINRRWSDPALKTPPEIQA